MPTSCKHDCPAKLGNKRRQVGDELVHPREGNHDITVSGDVERGNAHLCSGEGSQEFPVAIDIPVPIETAGKPGASEFRDVKIHVALAEPGRQRSRAGPVREPAAIPRYHEAKPGGVAARVSRRIPGAPVESAANGRTYISLKLGFSQARALKV